MNKHIRFGLIGALILILLVLMLKPVPPCEEKNCVSAEGIVVHIYAGGENDAVFLLKNNHVRYYINRGLENGLNLDTLSKKLMGQPIKISHPRYWTLLDPTGISRHISELRYGDEVIYTEMQVPENKLP